MQSVKTFIRLKPQSGQKHILPQSPTTVIVPKTNQQFNYEGVFSESSTNHEIFQRVCPDLIEQSLHGRNICVLAYGQTSTGKSHTILGDHTQPGLIPLCIEEYFKRMGDNKDLVFIMRVSYVEIYMENVKDLLGGGKVECKNGQLIGAQERLVRTVSDAYTAFNVGESSRKTARTGANNNSSRSHAIFKILLEIRSVTKQQYCSRPQISLVDLAGSEGISKTGAQGLLKRQGQAINKSLLALSNVVRGLSQRSQKSQKYVNFRDSKLTQLLRSSLTGKSMTSIICTVSTSACNLSESLNTLKFGLNAGTITSTVTPQQQPQQPVQQKAIVHEQYGRLQQERQALIGQSDRVKEQLGMALSRIGEMEADIQRWEGRAQQAERRGMLLQQNNMDLHKRIKQLNDHIKRLPRFQPENEKPRISLVCSKCESLQNMLLQAEHQLALKQKQAQIQANNKSQKTVISPIKARAMLMATDLSGLQLLAEKEMLVAEMHEMRRKYIASECDKDRLQDQLLEARLAVKPDLPPKVKDNQLGKMSKRLLHMRTLLAKVTQPQQ